MTQITLVVGNRNYSSWSLRGWLALKATGQPFEVIVVPLDRSETHEAIVRYSPSGRVPLLRHGEITVWESLAICEFLAETYPAAGLWPEDREARACARAVSSEMHAGFTFLRRDLPMDMRNRYPGPTVDSAAADDIARILEIWRDCRGRFGQGGPFLFGAFTAADAMYAPVVSRFTTYGISLDVVSAAYCESIRGHAGYREWLAEAEREPWVIEEPRL